MQPRSRGIRVLAWLLIGASAFLIAPFRGDDFEVLIGHYHCGAGAGEGYLWLSFEGSGDILLKRGYVQRSIRYQGSAAEECNGEAESMLALVQQLRCGTSPIRSRDDNGATREFDFVCSGQRTTVIQDLSAVSSQLVGISP